MDGSSDDNKIKGAELIADLKQKIKEVDALATSAISEISKEAKAVQDNPDATSKPIDVSRLEDLIREVDAIIYSPEVSGALADNLDNAASIKIIVNNLHSRIRREIEKQLIEKYSDLKVGITGRSIEGDPISYSDSVPSSSTGTLGGFFTEFVGRNFDDSRINYESRQLTLMKAAPLYSKVCTEKEANGEDYVGGIAQNIKDLECAGEDRKTTDMLFDKMKEYTPEKIAEIKEKLDKIKVEPEVAQKAYNAIIWYGEECSMANKEVQNNPSAHDSRKTAIEAILNGNPQYEKDLSPELIEVVRYLSIQYAYALSLSSDDKDKGVKDGLLACYKANGILKVGDLKRIIDQGAGVLKTMTDIDQTITRQKNRKYIESVKSLPNINETIFAVFPEVGKVISQLEGQEGYDGAGDALYSYLENFVKRYQNREFDQDIEELENYVISYRKAEDDAKADPSKTGDQRYAEQVKEQEELVNRYQELDKRKAAYKATKKHLTECNVKESDSELDLVHLCKLTGLPDIQLIQNVDVLDASRYSKLPEERRLEMEQMVFDSLSLADFERLRSQALEEVERIDAKSLVETGNVFARAWAFIRNTVRGVFGLRHIKTKRERTLNNYIKENYIRKMLIDNEKIQAEHANVKSEEPLIKDEEIRLNDIARGKAKAKRENTKDREDKYTNVPKAKKEDEVR